MMEFDTTPPVPSLPHGAPGAAGGQQAEQKTTFLPLADLTPLDRQDIAALHPRQFHNPQLGLELYAPGSWREEKNARTIQLLDSLTDARLEASGFARAHVSIEQWAAMRLPILQKEMPYLQSSGEPVTMQGENWAQHIQGLVTEYRGRASGEDEDTCVMICCMRTDELLLSVTITARASVYDAQRSVYFWMLGRAHVCRPLLAMQAASAARKLAGADTNNAREFAADMASTRNAMPTNTSVKGSVNRKNGGSGGTISDEDKEIGYIASGQRMLMVGILLSFFLSIWARNIKSLDRMDILILLFSYSLTCSTGLFGFFRMAKGFAWSGLQKLLMFILACIPFVSLFTYLYINFLANRRLKEEGYRVGLLGARDAIPDNNHDIRKLLIISVAICLLAYGLFTRMDAREKDPPLKQFSPIGQRYSVMFPGVPQVQTATGNSFNAFSIDMQAYYLVSGKIYYGVASFHLFGARGNMQETLDKLQDEVARVKNLQILEQTPLYLDNYPGRSLRVKNKELVGRIDYYVAGGTVYVVQGLGPGTEKDNRKIKEFLESFHLK